MADNELSFYRDLHKVAFFILVAVEGLTVLSALGDALNGQNGTGTCVLALVLAFVLRFLGRRAWPHRAAEFDDFFRIWSTKKDAAAPEKPTEAR